MRKIKDPAEWSTLIDRNAYFRLYSGLAISRIGGSFDRKELSVTLLERILYYYGAAAVVNTPEFGWVTLPVIPADNLNVYFTPNRWRAIGKGLSYEFVTDPYGVLTEYEGVIVRNDSLMTADVQMIFYFTTKIAEVEKVISNRLKAHMSPFLLRGVKQQALAYANLIDKVESGDLFVVVDDEKYSGTSIDLLTPQTPFIIDKLRDYLECLRDDCRSYLGLASAGVRKRERQISNEVDSANDEAINGHILDMLKARESAAQLLKGIGIEYKPELNREVMANGIRDNPIHDDLRGAFGND